MAETLNAQRSTLNASSSKRGWINTYFRYYKGKKLGPYYVRRWKHNGKTHKEYIKPQDLEQITAECQAYRERRKRQLICAIESKCLIDNHKFCLRMMTRLDKNLPIRPEWVAHLERIHQHGPFVPGRPRLRRRRVFMVPSFHKKFKNYLSDLKKVVLHERFGTSLNHNQQAKDHKQQFMVPSFANNPKKRPGPWVKAFESLRESVWDIWESVQRPNKDNALNRWLRAAR